MYRALSLSLILSLTYLCGCAFIQPKGDSEPGERSLAGVFQNKADRAPSSLAPPADIGSPNHIDAVNVRSQADYHFTLGETYALAGNTDKSIEEFKLTLVYDPKSALVHLKLATEYLKKGLISEAIASAEKAVEVNPKYVDAYVLLGGLYASMKLYDKAEKQYKAALKIEPNGEVGLYLGALLAEKGDSDAAIKAFDRLGKASKDHKHLAKYYTGRIHEQNGKVKAAKAAYSSALQIKPEYSDAVLALARIFKNEKMDKKAVNLMASFQERFGPDDEVAAQLAQHYVEKEDYDNAYKQYEIMAASDPSNLNVHVRMALILIEKKDFESALDKLKEILAQAPDSDKIRFYLGAVYEETKNYSAAVEQFLMIPVTSTYYSESRIHAAYLEKLQGHYKAAVKVMENAIESRPNVAQFHAMYGSLLDELKQYDKAIIALANAVEAFPKDEQLNFILGSIYDKVGKKNQTIEKMKFVLSINPDHVQALNYLAYTYAEMEINLDQATRMAQKALSMKPDDGYIQDTLGWVLYKKGKIAEAVKILEAAHRVKSDESIIAEHLADAYYAFDLVDKALQMYQKAAQLENDNTNRNKIQSKIEAITSGSKRPRVPASN